jgi:hypothetical protein
MRKLIWGGAAVALTAAALGIYLALPTRPAAPEPEPAEEQQEEPPVVRAEPPAESLWSRPMPGPDEAREREQRILAVVNVEEPIVVEGEPAEPPPPPEIGGAPLPGRTIVVAALEPDRQAPRPDEEPGQEQRMPYAEEMRVSSWPVALLWEAVTRLLQHAHAVAAEAEMPAVEKDSTEPPLLVPPPAIDYRYHHEMCCPYTGRCPIPYHPYPPPMPQNK